MPSARPRGMIVALWTGSDAGHVQRDERMPAFVIGGETLLLLGHHHRAAFGAHHHLVLGGLELRHGDETLAAARRQQRRLVDEVGEVGAGEAGRAARERARLDVGRQRHLLHVHLEDLLAADDVGVRHHDLTVEAARTQQRGIENVGAVRRRDEDDALIGLEAVHLDQQLVQRLLALVIAAAETGAAMTADRVDFVDEDDAGRVLLRLLEHVAHAARADADEHLDEVGTRDGEERHIRFAGDGAGEQRLAGAGRADEQHALRNASAETLELRRVAQEFDDLFKIVLRLVDAGDVLEGDAAMALGQQLRLRLAEAHGLAAAALHLAHEEDPDADQQQHREPGDEHAEERRHAFVRRLRRDRDALVVEAAHKRGIGGRIGAEGAAIRVMTGDRCHRRSSRRAHSRRRPRSADARN